MKKPFIFLSDFDGTISRKDFYIPFITGELKDLDKNLRRQYVKREITSFEYLNAILMKLNKSEYEIQSAMNLLPIDPGVLPLAESIREYGGDFAVVSAGADYYIRPILTKIGLDVPLYANQGRYINGGIEMSFPENDEFHSSVYGIAKENVVNLLKKQYEKVIFAGDGSADFQAAQISDMAFAKLRLAERLTESKNSFVPFETFADISYHLENNFFQDFS